MPSRWVSLGILSFWLVSMGWLAWREVWPQFRVGEPPPFTVDVFDEVQREHAGVRWHVFHNGKQVFTARTTVEHREQPDDTFGLTAEYTQPKDGPALIPGLVRLDSMTSVYRVDRSGDLVVVEARIRMKARQGDDTIIAEAYLGGPIQGGLFRPTYRLTADDQVLKAGDLDPVEVSYRGAVLLPLHPVHRISGLRPGQTWRVPLVDPLSAALTQLQPLGGGPSNAFLTAHVLPEPQRFLWHKEEVECRVIKYDGAEVYGWTWVRLRDDAVLCQEIVQGGGEWKMVREY